LDHDHGGCPPLPALFELLLISPLVVDEIKDPLSAAALREDEIRGYMVGFTPITSNPHGRAYLTVHHERSLIDNTTSLINDAGS